MWFNLDEEEIVLPNVPDFLPTKVPDFLPTKVPDFLLTKAKEQSKRNQLDLVSS